MEGGCLAIWLLRGSFVLGTDSCLNQEGALTKGVGVSSSTPDHWHWLVSLAVNCRAEDPWEQLNL